MKKLPINSGFTLVETLVAIAILMLATAGPLYEAGRAMVSAEVASSQLTASYLAQEGIEYMRSLRDNNYLSLYASSGHNTSLAWTNFLISVVPTCAVSCQFDPSTMPAMALTACSGASCTPLYLSTATKVYTQQSSGGTVTPFTRTIQLIQGSSTDYKIISTVSWSFHGMPYSETVADHITPWQ